MKYDPDKHHRRSIRLPNYNYTSPGSYFITICSCDRECLLGHIIDGTMVLNEFGKLIQTTWQWLGERFHYVVLDSFIVMPNHLHGILILTDNGRGDSRIAPTYKRKPLGRLVGMFKTVSTIQINQIRNTPG